MAGFPEVRVSPDGTNVAIRNGESQTAPWRASNGAWYGDWKVEDWVPMVRVDQAKES